MSRRKARELVRPTEGDQYVEAFATLLKESARVDTLDAQLVEARQARAGAVNRLRMLKPPVSYGRIAKALDVTEHAVVATHRRHHDAEAKLL